MRISTWNLEGKWSHAHRDVLMGEDCDLWLLTEVAAGTRLPGYAAVITVADMAPGKAWAAVFSRLALAALSDPHPASVAARVGDLVVCASVLPWRSCGDADPWKGRNQDERTTAAVDALVQALPAEPLVWGGDFNHALRGTEVAGSAGGAARTRAAADDRGLRFPTIGAGHRRPGVLTIDHIGVPKQWQAEVEHHRVDSALSDHDVYVVDVDPG